ncbi:MAG: hypothetical protein JNM81_14565 [Rhodospirillaceae bacterium]|nr:hypothetical protein [Rhodospirillaceae bacterium]
MSDCDLMLNALNLSRRRWMQTVGGGVACTALAPLGAGAAFARHDSLPEVLTAAIVQSHAQAADEILRDLAQVLDQSRKDLICFPALGHAVSVSALRAIAAHARAAAVHVAIGDSLITPDGDILSGLGVHQTQLGAIALVPSLFKPAKIAGADILLHLSAQPVSFVRAQTLAVDSRAHLIAATPVGDAFLQATGSVIFSPVGEVLAAAGTAWTQTLTAPLHVAHWRDALVQV